MKHEETTTQFETYSWKELKLQDPERPGEKIGNSIKDLIGEIQSQQPEIEAPAKPEVTEAQKNGSEPSIQPSGQTIPPGPVVSTDIRQISAEAYLQGWDMLFSNLCVLYSGHPEKLAYYAANKENLEKLSVLLGKTFEYYNVDPSPLGAFFTGFAGIYGGKTVEAFMDRKQAKVSSYSDPQQQSDAIEAEMNVLRKQIELQNLQAEAMRKPVPTEPKKSKPKSQETGKQKTNGRGGYRPGSGRKKSN